MKFTQMRLRLVVLLLSLAVTLVGRALYAQQADLFLAGTTVRLGMPKATVLGALEGKYNLTQTDENSWFIMEKGGPPYKHIGGLAFKDGKLSWASKDWGSFGERGTLDFANDLFSLLSNLGQEGEAVALIKTSTPVRQPGTTLKQIQLIFPNKKITLLVAEDREKGSSVSMQEILEQ